MTETDTQIQDSIDRSDPRWYYAILLAGACLPFVGANAQAEPGLITISLAVAMFAVFVMLVKGVMPEGNHA